MGDLTKPDLFSPGETSSALLPVEFSNSIIEIVCNKFKPILLPNNLLFYVFQS